ncbi:DUF2243 domain-containing protein [Actinomadura craniellae]|uniref:DUF2243 domain-containing protein n=1 Tax=Actinomadura craniellae TaxID=2231787 RepID=UPI00131413C8|nr:DUF2243 domain-containing protein [Actinomadura craniellae]
MFFTPADEGFQRRHTRLSGGLLGVGTTVFVEEILLTRVLHWERAYDMVDARAISGGLFHVVGLLVAVVGLFLLVDLRRQQALLVRMWWASWFIGTGGFQLWCIILRYGPLDMYRRLPYADVVAFAAAAFLAIGLALAASSYRRRSERQRPDQPAEPAPKPPERVP